ncbi:hypothetical protein M513_07887 [Trichuris suis]|uniref:Reverse transcriptase domain-containing protein n=1 Tax=Trichuris suis TaxID=68888 RepID=A0A085M241_9BILA|nr:hypothetical protein M513_07887 [Trichuris suis]
MTEGRVNFSGGGAEGQHLAILRLRNTTLEHHQYPLPLPEDIFATLNGGQYFSKIDLADAYLLVEVDEKIKRIVDNCWREQ